MGGCCFPGNFFGFCLASLPSSRHSWLLTRNGHTCGSGRSARPRAAVKQSTCRSEPSVCQRFGYAKSGEHVDSKVQERFYSQPPVSKLPRNCWRPQVLHLLLARDVLSNLLSVFPSAITHGLYGLQERLVVLLRGRSSDGTSDFIPAKLLSNQLRAQFGNRTRELCRQDYCLLIRVCLSGRNDSCLLPLVQGGTKWFNLAPNTLRPFSAV